jgi:Ca-activated chloride channel family protein
MSHRIPALSRFLVPALFLAACLAACSLRTGEVHPDSRESPEGDFAEVDPYARDREPVPSVEPPLIDASPADPAATAPDRTQSAAAVSGRGVEAPRIPVKPEAEHLEKRSREHYRHPPRPHPHPHHPPFLPSPPSSGEEYAPLDENGFRDARAHPLSTFSIDVDGASYANVRRFLQDNTLPPRDAVRIEELINSFAYDHPSPRGNHPFAIVTESAATPWNPDTRLVLVGLQGRKVSDWRRPAANLVFLIDVSGSMASADKLPLLKDAFHLLVDRLRPQDRISMVVYAGAAGMVLPPTPGDRKEEIREALDRLEAGGSTAGGAGLMLAYQAARESFIRGGDNRVILATDGDFNVGLSGDGELGRFIESKRRSGVCLSVLGFGAGNYKDGKMEALARKGNGNYFYIDGIREARKVLVERMAGTLHVVAKDVKLQVEFNPAAVKSYRLIGYENRVLAAEDFNDYSKDAGELGAGHGVTALYEVVPARPGRPRVDPLKYQDGHQAEYRDGEGRSRRRLPGWGGRGGVGAGELLTVKFRYKSPSSSESRLITRVLANRERAWEDASADFRFAAAVAGFGLLLRESRYRGGLSYGEVIDLARGAMGRDAGGDRAEFVRLAGLARLLAETEPGTGYGYGEGYREGYGGR